ncbi:His-Xaa-Ser system radical SAM maturase HxsC [Nocardioides mangrovicus]|uniref:His-Xaa-Ser system radical SAM maturase HxsC n=1 Tax=Nocardioides mangrovicus TaxID=2478913 RepID=A0A3L8P6M2_9ACTN|nr:His-Xaa-Ser system radical SAM maturase HxsC [Nocardioides mangrovicus]RLV50269.1 His-Xaa-Ser system radical SAM maturase HxsC [Nocardioides mangrovicus]
MIPLTGRTTTSNWTHPATDVWQVADAAHAEAGHHAVLVRPGEPTPQGAGLYVTTDPQVAGPGPTLHLPVKLSHVDVGDVLAVTDDGSRVSVVWKASAVHNSILLTERCDHYCLMCSQPPKERDDSFLYERARRIITALPATARALSLTGGEPTIDPDAFLGLLRHIAQAAPELSTHILSNGRRFADPQFAHSYASVELRDVMVGIPLYAADPSLHDYIVQAEGAFSETVKGILNLTAAGASVEIRIVLQKTNIDHLGETAHFIARNLPFVNQVALMGLEMTGLAKPNQNLVWVDPHHYRAELKAAHRILTTAHVPTRIYNHQLCVLERELWPAAVQSISDWKNAYPVECEPCVVRDQCAGVFTTSGTRLSAHLEPITRDTNSDRRTLNEKIAQSSRG